MQKAKLYEPKFSLVTLDGGILNKIWTHKDVSYDYYYLRVFSNIVFVHILRDGRWKLDIFRDGRSKFIKRSKLITDCVIHMRIIFLKRCGVIILED